MDVALADAFGISINGATYEQVLQPGVLHNITVAILKKVGRSPGRPIRERVGDDWTMDSVVDQIRSAQNIVVLTGAGISCSCGIPDFRSEGGVYAMVEKMGLDLPSNEAIFDIDYFREHPEPFFAFASQIWPAAALHRAAHEAATAGGTAADGSAAAESAAPPPPITPSLTHHWIVELERRGKLLRHYTQNIDGLEIDAGAIDAEKHVQCHGSFARASCTAASCAWSCAGSAIAKEVGCGAIPRCPTCGSLVKPDIVFFGEALPDEFSRKWKADRATCDLLVVIGSSLQVHPVASIPIELASATPRFVVNREVPPGAEQPFDVELLGDCDAACACLAARLGWATGGGDGGEGEGEGEGAAERETRREKLVEAEGGGEGGAPFEKRGARAFIFRNGGTPSEP